jgi:DNA repair photolyase
MEELKINGKAIYTTKGAAREYGRVGCNFYTGCPHECSYCYLKRGAPSKQLGGNVVQLKKCFKDEDDAIRKLKQDAVRYLDVLRKTGVFFSFTTDPLIPETRELTLRATMALSQMGIPVRILTKCADWLDTSFGKSLLELNAFDNIYIGFTLTGRDDMEPKASSNSDRIEAMRKLYNAGIKTWASIEPVIDWLSCMEMVGRTIDCCDHYKIGLRSGVKKDYYDLERSGLYLDTLTMFCLLAYRTVYLKESARKLLQRCYKEDYYNEILSRTVDMDGNYINLNK